MEFLNAEQMKKLGIVAYRPITVVRRPKGKPVTRTSELRPSMEGTTELFKKLVRLGWVDGLGRSQPWRQWQRKSQTENAPVRVRVA